MTAVATTGDRSVDLLVVGGGIVGLATADALGERAPLSLAVVDKEPDLAAHQTGNNSGVIHSGLYYRPGSAKARTCVAGRELMYRFCADHGVPHERCGKVVVATRPEQLDTLAMLAERGRANGLEGVRRIGPEELRDLEPHAAGIAALHVPATGIVDYVAVCRVLADRIRSRGGELITGATFQRAVAEDGGLVAETSGGRIRCRHLVACAGLHSDRVARACGVDPGIRIVPFRGEYYELRAERRSLVSNLIYPVPDPAFPFLGVHFTRRVDGSVEAGPNAVLAFGREAYRRWQVSPPDLAGTLASPGFWRLAARYWRTGAGEMWRSLSRGAFVRALQELVPELTVADVERGGAGIRAQALAPDGALVDDFVVVEHPRMLHVLNAPSPAATASLTIGAELADRAIASFGLAG